MAKVAILRRGIRFPFAGVTSIGGFRFHSTTRTPVALNSLPQSLKGAPTEANRVPPQVSDVKDFSTQVQSDFGRVLDHAVLSASALAHQPQRIARELDIVEAAANKHDFDKILLLINHGEAATKKNDRLGMPVRLTGRGVGQALTLSHQTSLFCTNDNGLSPELVVLAPLGYTIQTILHAFPYNTPDSVRGVDWLCHGSLCPTGMPPTSSSIITTTFPGMDLSHYESNQSPEGFLEWIRNRNEQVIVVSSTSDWLQSFCKSVLDCDSVAFQDGGEMKAVGLLY